MYERRYFMGFWVFMLSMDLLVPFLMIGLGRIFMRKAPKKINMFNGYRTRRSMKNMDTWEFAHKYCGRVWHLCGWILLPVTIIPMLFVRGQSDDNVGALGNFLCIVQVILLLGSVFLTERALKRNFDEDGNRR